VVSTDVLPAPASGSSAAPAGGARGDGLAGSNNGVGATP
jgi:hypothetical protein